MKRIAGIILSLICITVSADAQTMLEQGNEQYAAGNYTDAIETYLSIINEAEGHIGKSYATVYYNLGNAYYKTGELAQSIIAYERALRLSPTDGDIQYNLAFVQSHITDNITDTQSFAISNWLKTVRNMLPEQVWMWMSVILFSLCLVGILLFMLSREIWLRKTAFHLAWIMLLVAILSGVNAGSLHRRDTKRAEAVITQGIVNAKSSPDRSGTDLFTLHEGTKVYIKETLGEWCNIRVGNNQGWIKVNHLERI